MDKVRTMTGKIIDMGELLLRNEHVRAVGNMNVDATGRELKKATKPKKSSTSKFKKKIGNSPQEPIKQAPITKTPKPLAGTKPAKKATKKVIKKTEENDGDIKKTQDK